MGKVVVIGAGVDKSEGINMPLANQLIIELVKFTENEGKLISEAVKKQVPGMRFSFKSFVKTGIDSILESDTQEYTAKLVEKVDVLSKKYDTDRIKLFMAISSKLNNIKSGNFIDDDTIDIIKNIFSEEELPDITENSLLDLKFFTFTDLFKKVIGRLLEESIGLKQRSEEDGDNELYNLLLNEYLDFEKLLVDTFIGFYTKKKSDIKKYIYISWMLWAYLCWKEKRISASLDELPVYSCIPQDWSIITFNYTSFARKCNPNALYFHGSLNEYIRLDNRNILPISLGSLKTTDDIKSFLEGINHDIDKEIYFIPSIIPPLKLKPVISTNFLERWYKGKMLIEESDELIVVGYSFASADEHINDILRQYKSKKVTIINPAYKKLIPMLRNIYRVMEDDFTETTIQGKKALVLDDITIIGANADEIDFTKL